MKRAGILTSDLWVRLALVCVLSGCKGVQAADPARASGDSPSRSNSDSQPTRRQQAILRGQIDPSNHLSDIDAEKLQREVDEWNRQKAEAEAQANGPLRANLKAQAAQKEAEREAQRQKNMQQAVQNYLNRTQTSQPQQSQDVRRDHLMDLIESTQPQMIPPPTKPQKQYWTCGPCETPGKAYMSCEPLYLQGHRVICPAGSQQGPRAVP